MLSSFGVGANDQVMRRSTALVAAATVLAAGGFGLSLRSDGSVTTLAKADGWRHGFQPSDAAFGVLEVAYDAATAQALWDSSVTARLPTREGDPAQEGVYGDLADVDFTEEVVALWSSGESGSCPGWVSDVTTRAGGDVVVTRAEDLQGGNGCTADYNPYRTVIVIDRENLPEASALGRGIVDGSAPLSALVVEYPLA